MSNWIIKTSYLFCVLTVFLTSCGQKDTGSASAKKPTSVKKSTPAEKPADEKTFESEIIELIKRKTDTNGVKKHGLTILCWTVEQNYVDATKMLLENGANPDIAPIGRSTETALFSTAKPLGFGNIPSERQKIYKSEIIAGLLIKHGANVNHSSLIKETPLHKAALRGRTDLCELFIRNGANINLADAIGNTPLHRAAKAGYWETVQILLKNGFFQNVKNKLGETALTLAMKRKEESSDRKIREKNKNYRPGANYDRTIEILKKHEAK